MRFKKSAVNIGKNLYVVIQFNYRLPKEKKMLDLRLYFSECFDKSRSLDENIEELIESINSGKRLGNDECTSTIEISVQSKSILHLNTREINFYSNSAEINLCRCSNHKFYLISSDEKDFDFCVNKVMYSTSKIKNKLTKTDIEDFLYAMAYESYRVGNTDKAMDIIEFSLGDKFFTDKACEVFTFQERQDYLNMLQNAVHNKKISLRPKIWGEPRFMEGILEKKDSTEYKVCFLDLLDIFEKNGDKFIPLPSENYRKISKEVVDNYNVFKKDKSAFVTADFKDLIFTKDRLNISIKYKIPGHVFINPRQAKAVGFDTNVFSSKIYREQTMIKDGKLNIEKYKLLLSKDTLDFIKNLKIDNLYIYEENEVSSYSEYALVTLDASKLPVVERKIADEHNSLQYITELCYVQKEAECKKKVLKYIIENNVSRSFCDYNYTKEQFELLKAYGITADGTYEGIDNKSSPSLEHSYESRFFEFDIKGFSNLPKVEDVIGKIKAGNKRLNLPETIMCDFIKYLRESGEDRSYKKLVELLAEQKRVIRSNIKILSRVKLVKALTGGWWEGLKQDSKGNFLYTINEKTLIIKAVKKIIDL
jgi:hypothetical protein